MYIIFSGGIYFKLVCTQDIFIKIFHSSFLYRYIPSFYMCDNKTNTNYNPQHTIVIEFNQRPGLYKYKNFYIRYNNDSSIEDIITLLEYILCYLRHGAGIFSVHGSAVSYKNDGILLWGSISGIGKTTTALQLSKQNNFCFIGDENIYISDTGYIYDAVYSTSINKTSINFNYLQLSGDKPIYNGIKVQLIIQPILVKNGLLEFFAWDSNRKIFHIYEELSRRIRGCSRLINHWTIPIHSLDTPKLSQQRIKFAHFLAQNITAYTIKGNLCDVVRKIQEIILYVNPK